MIKTPAGAWKRFGTIGTTLALGAVVVLMAGIGSEAVQLLCLGILILLGLSGVSAALLERMGILSFNYSREDKQGLLFKMAQECAASERQIWGTIFSEKYYENYLGKPEGKTTKPKVGD